MNTKTQLELLSHEEKNLLKRLKQIQKEKENLKLFSPEVKKVRKEIVDNINKSLSKNNRTDFSHAKINNEYIIIYLKTPLKWSKTYDREPFLYQGQKKIINQLNDKKINFLAAKTEILQNGKGFKVQISQTYLKMKDII